MSKMKRQPSELSGDLHFWVIVPVLLALAIAVNVLGL